MFEVKKVIGQLLMPLPLSLLVLMLLLLWLSKQRKLPYFLCWLSVLGLWFLATPFMAQKITDSHYQGITAFAPEKHKNLDKIVVLGCNLHPDSRLPSNAQLGGCGLARLVEGVRLARLYPQAQLFVSGAGYGNTTSSSLMAATAQSLGVAKARIRHNPKAKDTAEEARLLAPRLVDYDVALVTSASHMHRAKNLFNAQGVEVIPAATAFYNFSQLPLSRQFIANHEALLIVTRIWHEKVGMMWLSLRRWIDPEAL